MEFCPKCRMRLVLSKNASCLVCPKCDFQKSASSETSTLVKVTNHSSEEQIAVIGEEEAKIRTMSTLKIECPKCSNKEAYWWMVQTRGSDESPKDPNFQ